MVMYGDKGHTKAMFLGDQDFHLKEGESQGFDVRCCLDLALIISIIDLDRQKCVNIQSKTLYYKVCYTY